MLLVVRVLVCFYATLVLLAPFFFFFNDTATTEIYTLSLHDALPIYPDEGRILLDGVDLREYELDSLRKNIGRSEEHTSELQSQSNLVCRLLLEKKKKKNKLQGVATMTGSSSALSCSHHARHLRASSC